MAAPLADRIRPQSLDEMVGQQHLLGPNGLLRRIAQSGTLPNLIFYGPSGVGKTTAARIIAAGAVVTKDVPDYAIAAGVPAQVIRMRKQCGVEVQ